MTSLTDLLPRHADPAAPLVTYYDDRTGERVELSAVTLANWVAKTSGFLADELEVEPGARLRIGLPTHWLRPVWLLSAWSVGAVVVDHDALIGLSGPELRADEPVRLAASLRPLGARFAEPPQGFVDIALEVPGQPDVFVALDPPVEESPALDVSGLVLTHRELAATTEPEAGRVLVVEPSLVEEARLLVAALKGSGSLVLVSGADDDAVERIAHQERATRTDAA